MDKTERLKKIYTLAMQGVDGEKEQAKLILEKLLKKYEMSIDEIHVEDEIVKEYYIKYHGKEQKRILAQVAYKVTEKTDNLFEFRNKDTHRKCRTEFIIVCTFSQKIEIEFLFNFYNRLYEKEKEFLMRAFIQKHRLFGELKDDESGGKLTDEEYAKIAAVMSGLSNETPTTAIERR